jgi:hypothetical protein
VHEVARPSVGCRNRARADLAQISTRAWCTRPWSGGRWCRRSFGCVPSRRAHGEHAEGHAGAGRPWWSLENGRGRRARVSRRSERRLVRTGPAIGMRPWAWRKAAARSVPSPRRSVRASLTAPIRISPSLQRRRISMPASRQRATSGPAMPSSRLVVSGAAVTAAPHRSVPRHQARFRRLALGWADRLSLSSSPAATRPAEEVRPYPLVSNLMRELFRRIKISIR